jgi:hypothetical protein
MTDRSRFGPGYLMPPVSFPVYGLDGSFTGARWLELFGDPPDGSPAWMALNHQSADGRSLIQVTNFVRRAAGNPRSWRVPTDAQAAEQGRSPLEDVARQGAIALISLALPVRSLTRPPGFLKALVDHADAAASAYRDWPQVSWRVGGQPVQVPVWRYAGGWTAFTDAAAGVYLGGRGCVPPRADPSWQRQEWHPDQLQLIREIGPDESELNGRSSRVIVGYRSLETAA